MAHIHFPDGILPIQWVLFWWLLAVILLVVALIATRKHAIETQRLAIAGMLAAVSFAVFQIDIPIAGGVHMNLTPLIGILAGPGIGSLIIFIVNLLSAAVGHGGWGLVGANTLVNMSEIAVAFLVFRITRSRFQMFMRGVIAAISGLVVGNIVLLAVLVISGIQGSELHGIALLMYLIQIPIINLIVAVPEAIITGFIVDYIGRVRPDLLLE